MIFIKAIQIKDIKKRLKHLSEMAGAFSYAQIQERRSLWLEVEKGITVEIGGDTTKLQTALKGVNSEIKNTQSQLTQALFISTFLRKLQIDFAA